MRRPPPPIAAVVSFIDCINRGDVNGLSRLMTDDHVLQVLSEPPVVGREANRGAWEGYVSRFPEYVIYPERIAERGGRVTVLGRTTGSHLGLSDADELRLTVIWIGVVRDGQLSRWEILEDTPANRAGAGLG